MVCTFWIVLMCWYQKWFLNNEKTSLACIWHKKLFEKYPQSHCQTCLRAARYLGLIKKIFQNLIKKMNYMHLSYCKIDKNGMRFVAITSSHVNCIPFHQQESDDGHERDELCLRKHERNVTRGGNKWAIEGPLYVVLETLSLVCVCLSQDI
jgi:hypothetical protein